MYLVWLFIIFGLIAYLYHSLGLEGLSSYSLVLATLCDPFQLSLFPSFPLLAFPCPASLPNSPCCFPRFPINGLFLVLSKATSSNQPVLCFSFPHYHLSLIALLRLSCLLTSYASDSSVSLSLSLHSTSINL